MVKLNFWEESAIYVLVFIVVAVIISKIPETDTWVRFVFLIILWLGLSSIIVKLIKGKSTLEKEERERKEKEKKSKEKIDKNINKFGNWASKSFKVRYLLWIFLILLGLIILISVLIAIFFA